MTLPNFGDERAIANAIRFSGLDVPVLIQAAEDDITKTVNQKQPPPIDDTWISLGNYRFDADKPAVITISNNDTDGHVIADAVQLLPMR